MKLGEENIEEAISACFTELKAAQHGKYDEDKAARTAAMFTAVCLQLVPVLADTELRAKHSKHEIERVEAEAYFRAREESLDTPGKKTEATLGHLIAKDTEVVAAKRNWAEAESDMKKYNMIFGSLKDGHYYFKELSKGKSNWA